MLINSEDQRLSEAERVMLREIGTKLLQIIPRQALPPEYIRELDRVYGPCCGEYLSDEIQGLI
jgi:hypothetical protein